MKAVILAGGYGTRFGEEHHLKPKPMIEIGNKPIIWHIMMIYSKFGFNRFELQNIIDLRALDVAMYLMKGGDGWVGSEPRGGSRARRGEWGVPRLLFF